MMIPELWSAAYKPGATDDDVRRVYLELVKAHPPDRDPEGFEALRRAYEGVRDAEARARLRLFGYRHVGALADLVTEPPPRRVGPDPWLRLLAAPR